MKGRLVLTGLQAATLAARISMALRAFGRPRHAPPPAEGPLRILMVAKYPERFAGTKYRLGTWARRLRAAGHHVDLDLPMANEHAERLTNDWALAARSEWHRRLLRARSRTVRRAAGYHVAVLHMEDLPFWDHGPPFVARALARAAGRLVLDLDDLPLVAGESTLRPRARQLAEVADGIIVGNEVLPGHYPGRPWWLVPTCIDPDEWPVPDRSLREGPPLLGWVGTPGNLVNLEPVAPALARVCRRHGARLRIVCSRPPDLPDVPIEFVRWSAAGEVEDLQPVDIGLAPLVDGPKQRAKCGLKALQYMASGTPVVASPVGALDGIVVDGGNGFLAADVDDWERALERLITDGDLRRRLGAAGREAVERRWSYAVHEATFVEALRGRQPAGGPGVEVRDEARSREPAE